MRGRRNDRNFNFKCNLNEIDKILEEGNDEAAATSKFDDGFSNSTSPINKDAINQDILHIQMKEECS